MNLPPLPENSSYCPNQPGKVCPKLRVLYEQYESHRRQAQNCLKDAESHSAIAEDIRNGRYRPSTLFDRFTERVIELAEKKGKLTPQSPESLADSYICSAALNATRAKEFESAAYAAQILIESVRLSCTGPKSYYLGHICCGSTIEL